MRPDPDPLATTPYHPAPPPPPRRRARAWPPWVWAGLVLAVVLLVGLPAVLWWGHWEMGRLAAPGGVPTLTADEMVRDFDRHRGKRVRVRGECTGAYVPGESNSLNVYLAAGKNKAAVVCYGRPDDASDFAGGGEVVVEGVVAGRNPSIGQVALSGCRRVR